MTRLWRIITLLSYFSLLSLLSLWIVWLAPPRTWASGLTLIVVVIGPLLLPLKGVLTGQPRTHLWLSLLAILYFVVGVFYITGVVQQSWLAWAEINLSVLLFAGSLGYARSRGAGG